jgi:hypothetical protein
LVRVREARRFTLAGPIFQNLIFEGHALGVVLLEPLCRSVDRGKDLNVLGVADLFGGVDVDLTGNGSIKLNARV